MTVHRLPSSVDTAIVGAGQAGLSMSWYLTRAGRDHVLLDRRELLGGGWRDRWDNFCLVGPNWTVDLPGLPYDGSDPDGFMPRDEIAGRIAAYAEAIDAPVVPGTAVNRLSSRNGEGFVLETSGGPLSARDVVVATGGFHAPKIPAFASALPARLTQLHTHDYRREGALPAGSVLVVGSAQSGVQIAEELQEAGRQVYLSVGSAGRLPRRYRGKDTFKWLVQVDRQGPQFGVSWPDVKTLPDPRIRFAGNPHVSGHGGGHDTNLRQMASDGIVLLGHLEGIDGERLTLAPDLSANLARADAFFDQRYRPAVDGLIERAGIDAPPDDRRTVEFEPKQQLELDLRAAGISTVIWASGYRRDYSWLDLPILDEYGLPRQDRGVSEIPGLYFIGLLWQRNILSSTLLGLGVDAANLAERMGLGVATDIEQVPA